MEFPSRTTILVAAVLGGVVLYNSCLRKKKLPPGPQPLPIIGNAHQMPTGTPWLTFSEMGKKFGQSFCSILREKALIFSLQGKSCTLMSLENRLSSLTQPRLRKICWTNARTCIPTDLTSCVQLLLLFMSSINELFSKGHGGRPVSIFAKPFLVE